MPTADSDWRARLRLARTRGRAWADDYVYAAYRQLRGPFEWRASERFASGEGIPVVLLAGVVEPWTMMLPVAERLHQAGHPVLVVPELAFNLASVRDAAAMAQAAMLQRDLRHVILVAHSKGGLVGKRLQIDDTEGRIAALIAIATPFHGSSLARLLPSRRSLRCARMIRREPRLRRRCCAVPRRVAHPVPAPGAGSAAGTRFGSRRRPRLLPLRQPSTQP